MNYYSQYKQDKFIDQVVLNKVRNGVFIDIGAYDGILLSNSYFFEKYRSFSGYCIEPNPIVFERLNKNRNCNKLNACIGKDVGSARFLSISGYGEMLSGLLDFYSAEHLERVDRTILEQGGEKSIIEVSVVTFDWLSDKIDGNVDFCSIDTEGNELSILQTINFNNIKIKCFTIENNYDDPRIAEFLERNGYVKIFKLSCDQLYVRKEMYNFSMKLRLLRYKLVEKAMRFFNK